MSTKVANIQPSSENENKNNKCLPLPPVFQSAQRSPQKGSKSKGYSPIKSILICSANKSAIIDHDHVPDTSFFDGMDSSISTDKDPLLLRNDTNLFKHMETPLVHERQNNTLSKEKTTQGTKKSRTEKINELLAQNQLLYQEHKLLKNEIETLSHRCIDMEKESKAQISELELKLQENDQFQDFRIISQKNEMDLRFEAIKALKAAAIRQEERIEYYIEKISRMKKEAKDKDEHIEEIEKAMAQTKKASLSLQKELGTNQAEIAGLQKELTQALEQVEELTQKNNVNVKQIQQLTEELKQSKAEIEKMTNELEDTTNTFFETSDALKKKEAEVEEMKGELENKIQKTVELEMAVEGSKDELKEDQEEEKKAEKQKMKEELEISKHKLIECSEVLKKKEAEVQEIKGELASKIQKILELEMTLEESRDELKEEQMKTEERIEQAREKLEAEYKEEISKLMEKQEEEKRVLNQTIADREEEYEKTKGVESKTIKELERISKSHLEKIKDLEKEKGMYKTLADNESIRWSSSRAIGNEEKKKKQLRLDEVLSGAISYEQSNTQREPEKDTNTSLESSAPLGADESKEKIVSLEQECEMLRSWARKALEQVKRLEKDNKASKQHAATMQKKLENQQKLLGDHNKKVDIGEDQDVAQSNVKDAAEKTPSTTSSPTPVTISGEVTSEKSSIGIYSSRHSDSTASSTIAKPGRWGLLNRLTSQDSISSIVVDDKPTVTTNGNEVNNSLFQQPCKQGDKVSFLQEENAELKTTISSLFSEMAQLKVDKRNEVERIKLENNKLQQENDAHLIKITVLENLLKENGVDSPRSDANEKKQTNAVNSLGKQASSKNLIVEISQHSDFDYCKNEMKSKSPTVSPKQHCKESYIIRDLEAKVRAKDIKIVSLQKKNDELEQTIASPRSGVTSVSETTAPVLDSSKQNGEAMVVGSDQKSDDSSKVLSDLRSQLSKSNERIGKLLDENDHQHENYEQVIQTLRQDIVNLKREKLQVKSQSVRKLQLVNEEKSKMEEDLQAKLQSHEETIVSLENSLEKLRGCDSKNGGKVSSIERKNEEDSMMNQLTTLKAEWEKIEKDLNSMIAERDAKIESLEKDVAYLSLKADNDEDLKLKLSGKDATIVHLEEEINSLVSIKTEKDEVAKDLLHKLTEREVTISNLKEEIRKLNDSTQSSSCADEIDSEAQEAPDVEEAHEIESVVMCKKKEMNDYLKKIEIIKNQAGALFEKVNATMDRKKQSKDQGVEDRDLAVAVGKKIRQLQEDAMIAQEEVKMSLHMIDFKFENQIGHSKDKNSAAIGIHDMTKEEPMSSDWNGVTELIRKAEDEMRKKIESLEIEVFDLESRI